MGLYSIIGIIQNDPFVTDMLCSTKGICLAPSYEWMAYTGMFGYAVWKFVLAGMKIDITNLKEVTKDMDKRLIRVEENMIGMKEDMGGLKESIRSVVGTMGRLQENIAGMQGTIGKLQGTIGKMQGSITLLLKKEKIGS